MTALPAPELLSPDEIKSLIARIRPVARRHDFPTAMDIDEIFQLQGMQSNARVWRLPGGEPFAYAFVHFPFNNLTFESADEAWNDALEDEVLAWALERMRAHHGAEAVNQTLDGCCRGNNARLTRFFERHGFEREAVESLAYALEITAEPAPQSLPEGFTIRPLRPERELEAVVALHQAAHGTQNFTLEDRLAVINTPGYTPHLDLVAVSPKGDLAGSCICSVSQVDGVSEGYTDPLVVHPRYQRRGLALALLLAGIDGLYQLDVRTVRLGTSSENTGMQLAAEAAGFKIVSRQVWYSMHISA